MRLPASLRSAKWRAPLSVCLVLAAAATLRAQPAVRTLSADELCRTSLNVGDPVVVTGKYKELIDEELYLFDCGLPLRLEHQSLFSRLLDFTPKKDNLTVVGVVGQVGGGRVVHVRELRAAPGDFALFHEEYLALEKSAPEGRGDRLVRLGQRVLEANKHEENPRLLSLAHQIFKDALELEAGRPGGNATTRRIDRIRTIHKWLQDDAFARDLVLPVLTDTPEHAGALEFLRELRCRRYNDRWVTHKEYKRLEGLVEYDGGWITPRELHHLRALEQFDEQPKSNLPILRRRTEKEYLLVAEEGRVETGMRREEVCLALGFPDFVLRRAYKRKEFDQWSYGKKYYYFYDGILVFVPPKD